MMSVLCSGSLGARAFCQSFATTWALQIVGKEPHKPSDWSRPDEVKKCYRKCADCALLHEFLVDPEKASRRFEGLDSYHLDDNVSEECETSTDESDVLTVTKTLRTWEKKHQEWQKRVTKAQEALKQLPELELKAFLAEEFEAIMDLRMVKLQHENPVAEAVSDVEEGTEDVFGERPQKRLRMDGERYEKVPAIES